MLALNEDGSIPLSNSALRKLIHRQETNHLQQFSDYSAALGASFRQLQAGR
ncbi:MAG: hypothetical protein RQ899_13895 [Pseudomonadales bacterium]|nr:hypothetical protein [Pseudomonadales bacterium]